MIVCDKDCFHVHTYRCGHAENVSDEKYVKAALDIGATGIWFTDHAPFPGDPFGNRMNYSELDEYLSSLSRLRENTRGRYLFIWDLKSSIFRPLTEPDITNSFALTPE